MGIYLSHLLKALKITRILKSFRSLKVIRLIKVVDSIFIIFSTILVSMQAVLSIVIMLGLIVLLFSIILYTMYAEVPNQGYFNTYGNTWFTLIQILTLDDWYGIYCHLVYRNLFHHLELVCRRFVQQFPGEKTCFTSKS